MVKYLRAIGVGTAGVVLLLCTISLFGWVARTTGVGAPLMLDVTLIVAVAITFAVFKIQGRNFAKELLKDSWPKTVQSFVIVVVGMTAVARILIPEMPLAEASIWALSSPAWVILLNAIVAAIFFRTSAPRGRKATAG